jgi:hypothetical protein
MKAMQYLRFVRVFGFMIVLVITGCITAVPQSSAAPFRMTMNTPNQFVVNDTVVDAAGLVKTLKKNRVPQNEPLLIEMTTTFPLETIKLITQKLATAGYKPIFKSPRHADASTNTPGERPVPSKIIRP